MATTCTRCEGSGFLNIHQLPEKVAYQYSEFGDGALILDWMETQDGKGSDVQVCDCCGNGEEWYGTPGEHYNNEDSPGPNGPYAYNGGLCECH